MSAPKQRTLKEIHQNDLKTAMLSDAAALLDKKQSNASAKKVHGDIRGSRNDSPLNCGVTKINLTSSEPYSHWESLNAAPTGKQRTVSPAESVSKIRIPRSLQDNKGKNKRKTKSPTPGELASKQRAATTGYKSVYKNLNIEASVASLKERKVQRKVPSISLDSEPPDVWKDFDGRPRTASPKKERTMPIPVMTTAVFEAETASVPAIKKTPKKRKLADRLTPFSPRAVSVASAQVTAALNKPSLYRTISPIKESVGSDLDTSNADSVDSSPAKTKKKHKNKPIETKTVPEPPIVNRKLETLNKVVSPKVINLKSVNKLEPVMEEEPTAKKRKKTKSKTKKVEPTGEEKTDVMPKTSLRKPVTDTPSKGKDQKKRKVSVIDSPTSLETGSLVIKHDSTDEKKPKNQIDVSVTENKYPVLKDDDLIKKFLGVSLNNNQKGRIRLVLKEVFQGTDSTVLPDVIHNKIQTILKTSANLTDTDLRKIRVLFNMLKLAVEAQRQSSALLVKSHKSKDKESSGEGTENKPVKEEEKKERQKKVKEPKRYVVFIGNLPPGIDKETIREHFSGIKEYIKDVRIPKREENKKSAIAYVELMNKSTYEIALSKHHSMLGSKRINVLFTTQKNSKMSKAEAKGKTAKLVAMVKSGQLAGSVALKKKRSQRRAKMRAARRQLEAEGPLA